MIKCEKCGTENLDSALFCKSCGTSLKKPQTIDVTKTFKIEEKKESTVLTSDELTKRILLFLNCFLAFLLFLTIIALSVLCVIKGKHHSYIALKKVTIIPMLIVGLATGVIGFGCSIKNKKEISIKICNLSLFSDVSLFLTGVFMFIVGLCDYESGDLFHFSSIVSVVFILSAVTFGFSFFKIIIDLRLRKFCENKSKNSILWLSLISVLGCAVGFVSNFGLKKDIYVGSTFAYYERSSHKNETSFVIPNNITSIGDYAFSGCTSLTSITIPDSVTSIGESAFRGCSSLTSITIPDSVTSIGDCAFDGCPIETAIIPASACRFIPEGKLKEVVITSGVSIGDDAFFYCTSLTSITIPDSVTSIGNFAFTHCSSLTSITIPSSVTSIGSSAFEYCSSLTSITIPNGVTSIGNCAFTYCSSLTSITIPSSVTSIGFSAFWGCSSLTSITIPSSVTSIGEAAFCECSSLTIYCEAASKPSGWASNWNYYRPVVWGYTPE